MSVSGPSNQNQSSFSQIIQDEIYYDERSRGKSEDENLYIDTGSLLPQEMSTFYSLNFPNLSAVSASECNIQSFTTISSGIAPEAELAVAEDKGVNSTTRDLVLAAITVMKGRKARPDTKRICNWVNRKYGRSVQEVVQEIDDLCQKAVLEKVDYKGSISFRITSEKKLHKRVGRRKNSNQERAEFPPAPPVEEPIQKSPRPPSPKKSPRPGGKSKDNPAEKMDPVTLNLLLREEIKVATEGLVTKENIVKALELTKRPINKRAVYRDLETILAHEIHLGYLVKHAENSFTLASINKDKHYRGTIPLKSSKRKPKPTQKYLEMEAELQKNKPEKYSEYMTFDGEGNFPFFMPGVAGISPAKSDEELKDDLIKEKLINSNLLKIKSKMKSGKAKTKKENSTASPIPDPGASEPILPALTQKLITPRPETTVTLKDKVEKKSVLVPIKPKFKKETWQVSITVKESKSRTALAQPPPPAPAPTPPPPPPHRPKPVQEKTPEPMILHEEEEEEEEEEECREPKPKRTSRKRKHYSEESEEETVHLAEAVTRTLSGRKKRARKIFDPADHDVPSRIIKKCRTGSPTFDSPSPALGPKGSPQPPQTEPTSEVTRPAARPEQSASSSQPAGHEGSINRSYTAKKSAPSKPETGRGTAGKDKRESLEKPLKTKSDQEVVEPKKVTVKAEPVSRRKSTENTALNGRRSAEPLPLNGRRSAEPLPLNGRRSAEPLPLNGRRSAEPLPLNGRRSVEPLPLNGRRSVEPLPLNGRRSVEPLISSDSLANKKKSDEKIAKKKQFAPQEPCKEDQNAGTTKTKKLKFSNIQNSKQEKQSEGKIVGPRKTADPVIKTSALPTISKTKKDNVKKENIEHYPSKPTSSHKKKPLEEPDSKPKPEPVEPTFKVPAPKKPLPKPTQSERQQNAKQNGAKSKPIQPIKPAVGGVKGWGGGKTPTSPKSASRSTRASTLTVSLRAKKDPKDRAVCMKCNTGNKKNEKLIFCKDCDKILHPSCLNYPEDLTDRIYKQAWQCIDCKMCFICHLAGNDDKMLFCDSCDLGYHMTCHRPPISRKPRGRWECDSCAAETGYRGETDEKFQPPGAATFFEELLPPLPPGVSPWPALGFNGQFCPAPDQYPPHWQDLPLDESIPDISGWSPARMSQYLVQNGIKDTAAKVFFDQEIDGASALVLQRQDVLKGLGLKLGPALKIFHHIKRLQTRRDFGLAA